YGDNGQALITSGSGNLSWSTIGPDHLISSNNLSDVNIPEKARANLGLKIGDDVQKHDDDLDNLSGLVVADGNSIVGNDGKWITESGAELKTRIYLGNVENIELSTWPGSTNITTLGTISSGKFSELSASGHFYDSDDEPGTNGQILSSTGDGVVWTDSAELWTLKMSGNDIYRESGNVGVGTSEPEKKIHVEGDGILVRPDEEWGPGDVANFFMGDFDNYIETDYDAGMEFRTEGDFVFSNGNVGIGVTGPQRELEIKGALKFWGATSGFVVFTPPVDGEEITYTLPASKGSAGQALTTDGDGALGWATIGADHLISTNYLSEIKDNPETARANLGLEIGVGVQAHGDGLDDIAGLAADNGNFIVGNGEKWATKSDLAARTSIGLGNVDNISLLSWPGSTKITTLGTIAAGKWQGEDITADYIDWASPEDIGSGEAAAGNFTTLSASGEFYDAANEAGTSGQILSSTGSGLDWIDQGSIDDGDWTKNGDDVYKSTGNVGIGTTEFGEGDRLAVDGFVHSSLGGFKFPDGTVQTTAANVDAAGNIKQLIKDFTVASGKSVTAGDVVSFVDGYIQKGFGTGKGIIYGSEHVLNSAVNHYLSAAALSSNKFVIAYYKDRSGIAVIGDVIGNIVTYGSEYVFRSANITHISVAALSSTKFVVTFEDQYDSFHAAAVIGDVSGNSITYGSRYVFQPTYSPGFISTTALSSTKFVMTYWDDDSSDGSAVIGDVTGDAITYGEEHVFNPNCSLFISAAALSSTKFVVAYTDCDNIDNGTAVIGDVTGNNITFGPEHVFTSAPFYYSSVAALSTTKFVVAYQDPGSSDYGMAVIGDVSGDTITSGAEYVFNSASTGSISATALSPTRFVVAYRNIGASNHGMAVIGDVSGDTIDFGAEYTFNSTFPGLISAGALSSTRFVVAYQDGGNGNFCTASVGEIAVDGIIGIAREAKTGGQTTPVIIAGVSEVHSGLTPGAIYYADASGDLTTGVTDYKVGLAISSTKLLLNVENTRLSEWTGSDKISTLGAITSGEWRGAPVAESYIGDLPASKITSGVFDNVRVNWKAPGFIGSITPAAGKFTELSASGAFYDSANEPGTSGQILSSTGSGLDWIDNDDGDWTISGDNIYREDGNVGIGTTSPGAALHVEGVIEVDQKIQANDSGGLELATDEGETRLIIQDDGNVGVGVASPDEKLSVGGIIESTSGGFKFPDDTVQTTAAKVGPGGNIKQLIKDFTVASGKSVTAGDVVSFVDGTIQKGFLSSSNVKNGPKYSFNSGSRSISAAALSATKFV
ncbi:MAG: hypothetical protein GY869_14515, partial [Planctomycetes bacterium]|nr:hypothetical protein [Planctomycetota bacterium]